MNIIKKDDSISKTVEVLKVDNSSTRREPNGTQKLGDDNNTPTVPAVTIYRTCSWCNPVGYGSLKVSGSNKNKCGISYVTKVNIDDNLRFDHLKNHLHKTVSAKKDKDHNLLITN